MKCLIKEKLSPNKMKTSEGYLICKNAILARTGKQEYLKSEIYPDSDDDSIISIDRKPEQVFAEETLASFNYKPLTCEHPSENVNPDNYRELSVGYVVDVKKGRAENQDVILGTLIVTDPQCIEDIENGYRTDLSCGYDCDITDGDHPQQINIRGNHVALCMEGRAGIARIVDSKKIKDSYVAGAQYETASKTIYQIIEQNGDNVKVIVNGKETIKSSKELDEMIKDGFLKHVTTAKAVSDSTHVYSFDSYMESYADRYRGITIEMDSDARYIAEFNGKKYKNGCLEHLKEILDKEIEKDIEKYSKKFEVKEMKPMSPNKVSDSVEETEEYSPRFYRELSKILEKKIKKVENEEIVLDSEDDKELIQARHSAKRTMREQYNKYSEMSKKEEN